MLFLVSQLCCGMFIQLLSWMWMVMGSALGQDGGPGVVVGDVAVGGHVAQPPHGDAGNAHHPGQGELVRHAARVLIPQPDGHTLLCGVEGGGVAVALVVGHHGVRLGQALCHGVGGGAVDGGVGQQAVFVHLEAHGGEGDLEDDLALVLDAGLRVGDGGEGPVDVGEGGHRGVGGLGAHVALRHAGPLVVVGHEDDLVAHLADGPVVVALVPVVGGDADVEGLACRQGGAQLGEEGDEVGLQKVGAQALEVDDDAGVVGAGRSDGGDGLAPGGGVGEDLLQHAGGGAVGKGDVLGGVGVDVQIVGGVIAPEIVGGSRGVGGLHPVVAVGLGGVEDRSGVAPLHPGPAQADGVHVVGEVDLGVGGEGIEAGEEVHLGLHPLVDPVEHGGGLPPGGEGVGLEEELAVHLHTGGETEGGGQGDVAGVVGDVGERDGGGSDVIGQGLVAQGPDQHDGHVLPGDVGQGLEELTGVHHPVGQGGLGGGIVPVVGGDVGKGGGLRGHALPAEHPLEDGDEAGPVEPLLGAEGAVIQALDEAVVGGLLNVVVGPVLRGDVGELHRQGRGGQGREKDQTQGKCGQTPKDHG